MTGGSLTCVCGLFACIYARPGPLLVVPSERTFVVGTETCSPAPAGEMLSLVCVCVCVCF